MESKLEPVFAAILADLPEDWSQLVIDLRIADEQRYVEACLLLTVCDARPYSEHDWHWRIAVAHRFGTGAAAEAVTGALRTLDEAGIAGELVVRETRCGRAPVLHGWGRPESARRAFRELHRQ